MDLDIACPQCRRVDALQSVPGLYSAGISTSSGSHNYSGVGITSGGVVPVFGTATIERTHTTALAASLAPAPALLPVDRLTRRGILWTVPVVFVAAVMVAAFIFSGPDERSVAVVLMMLLQLSFLSIPGAATLGSARQQRRRNAVILRGRATARNAWQTAFYCHRCGTVHWPAAPIPMLPVRQALAPSVFRWHVWNAGGYAHL